MTSASAPAALVTPLEALPQHEAWLRTSLFARLGNREEVDEVMQEVAVAAANQAAKSEPVHDVGPWLYRVAMRQMMQLRRKAGRRRKLLHRAWELAPRDPASGERTPIEFLVSQERQQEVRRALEEMEERDRQLLLLKYVEGLSYGQIAQRLGVTAGAVQSRLHRARRWMRKRLLEGEQTR